MITIRIDNDHKEREYPYLGRNDRGVIVLFTSPESGIIVHQDEKTKFGKNREIGYYFDKGIKEHLFTLYTGEIILKNS